MVFFESLDGILEDRAKRQVFCFHSFFEDGLVVIGDRADEADRLVGLVLHQIAANKLHEMVVNKVVNTLIVDVVGAELGEFGEEAIREGLTIHFLNNIRHRGLIFLEESVLEVIAQLILEQVAHETFAEDGCRTLVA